jgi:hypothetical protein
MRRTGAHRLDFRNPARSGNNSGEHSFTFEEPTAQFERQKSPLPFE